MSVDRAAELARFQQFIVDRLGKGESLSPEEALDLWRIENPDPADLTSSVEALQEALAEMDGGDTGMPLAEFDRTFRVRHGLSGPQ